MLIVPFAWRVARRAGVRSLMRAAGVEERYVFTPDGAFLITARRPSVPIYLGDR
jgi:hypothetical protein